MTPDELAELSRHMDLLPAMPAVRTELLLNLTQEDVGLATVARLVAADQVIAAKVLRVANSTFFGLGSQVESLVQAVTLLGFSGLQSIALACVVMDSFKLHAQTDWFDQMAYWRHSIGTATCAQLLAERAGVNPSSAFTAGLLHDLGQLVMVACYPQRCRAVLDHRRQSDGYALDSELRVFGFHHGEVGDLLGHKWNLPVPIRRGMALHHHTQDPRACTMVKLVHVADALAHALDLVGDPDELVPEVQASAWDDLNVDWSEANDLFAAIERRFHQVCASLVH